MAKLVLIRHGQSQWNLENRFTGWEDIPLTDLGREEALRAAALLKDIRFDIAYTSGLVRAQETLSIILKQLGQNIPVIPNAALNERNYGNLQGLNKDETAAKYGKEQVHIWRRSYSIKPPGGESLEDTYKRTIPYYKEMIVPQLKEGKNVLVAAHGNSLRSIVMYLEHLTEEEVLNLNIPTATPYIYDIHDGTIITAKEIRDINSSAHSA